MEHFKRDIQQNIKEDLKSKIVLLSGPRQVGKTTLTQKLDQKAQYINYDNMDDRSIILKRSFDRQGLIIFDELHKLRNWKSWLKGIYDHDKGKYQIIVTGSSRLDIAKKMGDSLAGRFFLYHLHPLTLKELKNHIPPEKALEQLLKCSGFPEPFFKSTQQFYNRWRHSHLDIILRQDLASMELIHDIGDIENLILLLQDRVGGTIKYANLAHDLGRDPKTIKRWITILENLFIIFTVSPYTKSINKAILKEPKVYFYDVARIKNPGAQLENLVALSLKKELDYILDTSGTTGNLGYLRNKDGKELDFIVTMENGLTFLFEVKTSDETPSKHFNYFSNFFNKPKCIQLVKNLKRKASYPSGVEIHKLSDYLTNFDLT